jgi:tellurite resistance protein TerC
MEVSLAAWLITITAIALLFLFDLGAALLRPRKVHFPEALTASIFYIAVALLFGVAVGVIWGWQWGTEYFTGYVLEKSLSIDNLFVFVVIISAFAVPEKYQQRVLIAGIFLALIFRIVFISLGAALLSLFSIMFFFFGLLLLWTAVQLYRHRNEEPDINDNIIVKAVKKRLPFSDNYGTGRLTTKESGQRVFTPILLVLIAIATTDLLFALDSIPAIFGVTQEVYLVFTANAFALLGLRALFFLVTGLLERLVYLSTGLSLILGLIGIKLILHWLHTISSSFPEIPTTYSLVAIIIILITTTIASIIKSRRDPTIRAHPGAIKSREEENV